MVARRQDDQVIAAIFLINTDDIEQVEGKVDQLNIVILLGDQVSQRLGFFAAVGVQLQQTVTALFQLGFQAVVLLAALAVKLI